jgi:D-sedoheptulose 7-phosphate isomerase
MKQTISDVFSKSVAVRQAILADKEFLGRVEQAARMMAKTISSGGTIYACGNGGSACDAMHLTEELVARYKRERRGIKAVHLMDPGTLTCWSNDYSFEDAFARQVRTFCGKHDLLVAISTSGNSPNILKAVEAAKAAGAAVIGLTGKDGGKMAKLCTAALVVPAQETERIQEIHITLIHIFCELLETELKSECGV